MSKYRLPKIIREKTYMSFKKYCKERLNCEQMTMYRRMSSGRIPMYDLQQIMLDTGCGFDELFGDIISAPPGKDL